MVAVRAFFCGSGNFHTGLLPKFVICPKYMRNLEWPIKVSKHKLAMNDFPGSGEKKNPVIFFFSGLPPELALAGQEKGLRSPGGWAWCLGDQGTGDGSREKLLGLHRTCCGSPEQEKGWAHMGKEWNKEIKESSLGSRPACAAVWSLRCWSKPKRCFFVVAML